MASGASEGGEVPPPLARVCDPCLAVDPSNVEGPINIDDLLAVIGAAKASSSEQPSNVAEGIGRIVDAASIGNDIGEMSGISGGKKSKSNITIFKCDACGSVFQDSSGVVTPSSKTPTTERGTHY